MRVFVSCVPSQATFHMHWTPDDCFHAQLRSTHELHGQALGHKKNDLHAVSVGGHEIHCMPDHNNHTPALTRRSHIESTQCYDPKACQ